MHKKENINSNTNVNMNRIVSKIRKRLQTDPSLFFSPVPGNYQTGNRNKKNNGKSKKQNQSRQTPLRKRTHAIDIALDDITNHNFQTEDDMILTLATLTNYYQLDDREIHVCLSNDYS
mmetsp:Transcript_12463/g.19208  ORF Transcript_12463/g.19208 Transcript_12463/m.19208 type:complete len:118 (-) Transcript_12463:100-453(-)